MVSSLTVIVTIKGSGIVLLIVIIMYIF